MKKNLRKFLKSIIDYLNRRYRLGYINSKKYMDGIDGWLSNPFPKSNYGVEYPYEVTVFAELLDVLLDKYDISMIQNNRLGYRNYFEKGYATRFLLYYNFPSDCFPMLSWIKNYYLTNRNIGVSFDVGANAGIVSCFLGIYSKYVYAFEPTKKMIKKIYANLDLNNISNVKVENCGCSDIEGYELFHDYGCENSGHNSFIEQKNDIEIDSYECKMITLDGYCEENNILTIDILKVDAEGYEPKILKGCQRLLKERRVRCILFEISPEVNQDWDEEHDMVLALKEMGYEFYDMNNQKIMGESLLEIDIHQDVAAILA